MQNIDEFFAQAQPFVALFDAFVEKHRLFTRVEPDHICYKCGSRESFEQARNLFEREGANFWSSRISGRTISYVVLPRGGLVSQFGLIKYLELADQKPDGTQHDGFDHIEAYPLGWRYEQMIERLSETERVVEVERPHHSTHDIDIGEGFLFRATREPLIEKIVREEILPRPAI